MRLYFLTLSLYLALCQPATPYTGPPTSTPTPPNHIRLALEDPPEPPNRPGLPITTLPPSPSPTPNPPAAQAACLSAPACTTVLTDISTCYNTSGTISDPSDPYGQSLVYQTCLCDSLGGAYKNILHQHLLSTADAPQACLACLVAAGASDSAPKGAVQGFLKTVHGFCNSAEPNLYLFLRGVLAFVRAAHADKEFHGLEGKVSDVVTWEGRFTSRAGMNVPSSRVVSTPVRTAVGTGKGFPTWAVTQVPSAWPYTGFGVGRRGETATWALTSVGTDGVGVAETETVGLVKAVVEWFPRPVYTGGEETQVSGVKDDAPDKAPRRVIEGEEVGDSVSVDGAALRELWDEIQAARVGIAA